MKIKPIKPKAISRSVKALLKQHGPLICMISAGIGFTGAIGFAVKGTIQAVRRSDYEAKRLGRDLTVKELVELNWRYYVPSILMWFEGVLSMLMAAKGYDKALKFLASMYAASEAERNQLEKVTLEKLGPKKYEELQNQITEKRLQDNPVSTNTVYVTGTGDFLCYDSMSGRYFRSCIDHIKRAQNNFNARIFSQKCGFSYNDFFYEVSPVFNDIIFGKDVGWGPEKGGVDIRFSTHIADNGEPCLVMDYRTRPYVNFDW